MKSLTSAIYRPNTFLRNLNEKRRRSRGVSSPHKTASRNFLRYLRENNYIAKSGKEFSQCEVDDAYFEKSTRLANIEAERLFWEHLT